MLLFIFKHQKTAVWQLLDGRRLIEAGQWQKHRHCLGTELRALTAWPAGQALQLLNKEIDLAIVQVVAGANHADLAGGNRVTERWLGGAQALHGTTNVLPYCQVE